MPQKPTGFLSQLKKDSVDGKLDPDKARANQPPANTPPANTPPGNTPPANTPPANTPPANTPPGNTPPANTPPGKTDPGPDDDFKVHKLPGVENVDPGKKVSSEFDEAAFDAETQAAKDNLAFEKFAELRSELKKFKKGEVLPQAIQNRMAELEGQVNEMTPFKAEVEALRDRMNQLASTNARSMMEASDIFAQEILAPRNAIMTTAKAISEAHGVELVELEKIIKETDLVKQDAAIEKLANKFGPRSVNRLMQCCDDYREIGQRETVLLENASEHLAQHNRLIEERHMADIQRHIDEVKNQGNRFVKQYATSIPGWQDENGILTATAEEIRGNVLSTNPAAMTSEDEGYAIFAAAAFGPMAKQLRASNARIAALEAELAKRESGGPSIIDGKPNGNPTQREPGQKPEGLLAHFRRTQGAGS